MYEWLRLPFGMTVAARPHALLFSISEAKHHWPVEKPLQVHAHLFQVACMSFATGLRQAPKDADLTVPAGLARADQGRRVHEFCHPSPQRRRLVHGCDALEAIQGQRYKNSSPSTHGNSFMQHACFAKCLEPG